MYIDESSFRKVNCRGFYANEKEEEIPPKLPAPQGNSVRVSCYIMDADQAGIAMTRRRRTGVLVPMNNTLIS